jgi:hypothetical protein
MINMLQLRIEKGKRESLKLNVSNFKLKDEGVKERRDEKEKVRKQGAGCRETGKRRRGTGNRKKKNGK